MAKKLYDVYHYISVKDKKDTETVSIPAISSIVKTISPITTPVGKKISETLTTARLSLCEPEAS